MINFRIIPSTSLPGRNFSRQIHFKNNSDLSSLFPCSHHNDFQIMYCIPAVCSHISGRRPKPKGLPGGKPSCSLVCRHRQPAADIPPAGALRSEQERSAKGLRRSAAGVKDDWIFSVTIQTLLTAKTGKGPAVAAGPKLSFISMVVI